MIMKYFWMGDFSKSILQRGKDYFFKGLVHNLKIESNEYAKATVFGSDSYFVTVRKTKNGLFRYNCDCPYGLNCKHEAAVCYALEENDFFEISETSSPSLISGKELEKNISEKEIRVFPFKDFLKKDDSYHYYDMEKMTERLEITKEVLKEANKIIDNNEITCSENFSRNSDGLVFSSEIKTNRFPYQVNVYFNHNSITGFTCNAPECRSSLSYHRWYIRSNKVCPHSMAALLKLGKYLYEENPGDATDYSGNTLFEIFRGQTSSPKTTEERIWESGQKEIWSFDPQIEIQKGYFTLGFKIGNKKKYVAKEFNELISAWKNKGIFEQTANTSFDFSKISFDARSEKFLKFVQKILEEENVKRETASYSYSSGFFAEEINNSVKLYGRRLDDFFELSKDLSIPVKNNTYSYAGVKDLSFREKNIRLQIQLDISKNDRGQVESISCVGHIPEIFYGLKNIYFIEDSFLNRTSSDFSEKIKMFSKISGGSSFFSLNIGRKKISQFMNQVLPWLRTFSDITEEHLEEVFPLVIPKPEYEFFLDSQDDIITCLANVYYGQTKYDLYDWIFGEPKIDLRDYEEESKVHNILSKYFLIDNQEKQLATNDEDQIFKLFETGLSELMELGQVNTTENFSRIKIKSKINTSLGIKLESGLLDLDVTSDEVTREELLSILAGMRKKKKYVRLRNGDFVSTEDETLQELDRMINTLHLSEKELLKGNIQIPSFRALYLDKMLEGCRQLNADRDKNFRSLVKEFKTVDDSDFEAPELLQKTMRNYQIHGFKWLRTLKEYNFSGILADDMGLGKTLQTISLITSLKNEPDFKTSLIVCPASLVFNWKQEFSKFAPELNVCLITGTAAERKSLISDYEKFDALITSYDLIKRDIAEYENKSFFYEIIDEGQFIKNQSTSAAKSVKIIQAEHRLALTGTPIENRLSELWSIFDYLMPGFLFSYDDFRKRYELPIVKNKDEKTSEQLRRMVAPFILRRLKKDVLSDLPEKTEEIYFAQLEGQQKKLYDAQAIKLKQSVEKTSDKDFSKKKIQILAELTKIRQICCDPSLAFENYNDTSSKKEACLELIEQGIEGEHKMLVFSQFTSMLEILQKELENRGIRYFVITGSTSKEARIEMVNQFNSDDTPVFLISLKAGGTGLNLTGADVVIHYDPWWNLAAQNQATDRAHRIGQTKSVTVFKLIAKDTIEEKIVELQNSKKDLADQILSGENGNIGSLSKEELLSLFE